jgi:hypothetical protein
MIITCLQDDGKFIHFNDGLGNLHASEALFEVFCAREEAPVQFTRKFHTKPIPNNCDIN